jgi:gas vesicle protein
LGIRRLAFWLEISGKPKIQIMGQLKLRKSNPRANFITGKDSVMRYGKYESSERSGGAGTALSFLLIGLGVGTVLGLLYAPKPGKQTRKELRRRYEDARDTFEDWKEDARDFAEEAVERGTEIADEVRERVKPIAKAMRR